MSENNFQQINQNQYRGSRYSSFVGGGADSAGNVTPAYSENTANTVASSDPNLNNGAPQPNRNFDNSLANIQVPDPILKGPSSGLVTGGLQYAAPTIGARVGANLALGSGLENAFSGVGSELGSSISSGLSRVSGGLIGNAGTSTATNAALSSMGGKLGPATSSSVSTASKGAGFGSAAGAGIASAAATLLTGGSVKDAVFAGAGSYLGSAAGSAAGAAIGGTLGSAFPVIGTIIGSFLGSKLGGLFGGKPSDKSQGSILNLSDSTYNDYGQTGKKFSQENRTFVTKVRDSAKSIAEALRGTGAKFTGSLDLLVGNRDGLRLNGTNYGRDSGKFIDSVGRSVFKQAKFDAPDKQNTLESGLTNNSSLDDIYRSLTGTYNQPTIRKPRQATFYS